MKPLQSFFKNNVWYIVIGATIVTIGACVAIVKPWEDNSLEVGTWEPYMHQGFNSSIEVMIKIENDKQRSKTNLVDAKGEISKSLNEYHCTFTNKEIDLANCGSEKNVLGLNKSNAEFEISKKLYDALEYGIEMNEKTNGYFSIAQGKILSLWKDNLIGKKTSLSETAARDALQFVLSKVDENKNTELDKNTITLKSENGKYFAKRNSDVTIDLGGIAKAIATDSANTILTNYGYTNYYINSGGSSWTIKGKYISENGKIGVVNPAFVDACGSYEMMWMCNQTINNQYYKALEIDVTDISLGTSGDYADNNFITIDGKRYHHIINPKTGLPSENVRSTTILATSAMEADVWSTTLMAAGLDVVKSVFATDNQIIATYFDGTTNETKLSKKAEESKRIKVCLNATDC